MSVREKAAKSNLGVPCCDGKRSDHFGACCEIQKSIASHSRNFCTTCLYLSDFIEAARECAREGGVVVGSKKIVCDKLNY